MTCSLAWYVVIKAGAGPHYALYVPRTVLCIGTVRNFTCTKDRLLRFSHKRRKQEKRDGERIKRKVVCV